jgi:uncharacterized membrane protein
LLEAGLYVQQASVLRQVRPVGSREHQGGHMTSTIRLFALLAAIVIPPALLFFALSKIRKDMPFRWANVWKGALTLLFFVIGVAGHLVSPQGAVQLIPPFFPLRELSVYATGILEIAFAIFLWTRWERETAWIIIAYLAIVIFFNIYGWTVPTNSPNYMDNPYYLWVRVPMQALFIAFAYYGTRPRKTPNVPAAAS